MERAKGKKQDYSKYVIVALVVVFLVSAGLLVVSLWENRRDDVPVIDDDVSSVEYNGTEYVLDGNVETFLVLGLDKFDGNSVNDSYNNDQCADFLMLFVFNNASKKFSTIHINRDTMVEVNILDVAGRKYDTVTQQITLAHTYGNGKDVSCRNTADAVSGLLLGMKIDHYISFTLDSVGVLNDLVGGVEVTVLDDFSGVDDTLVKGETVKLLGDHALSYIRTRYGLEDSTNISRMKRQQQYIKALYSELSRCIEADENFIVDTSIKMSDYIVSDRSVTRLQEIAKKMSDYEFVEINDIEGTSRLGVEFMEFYPDGESVKKVVIDLFYKPKN